LEVAIKKPTANEAIPCTLMGPTYPQVHITEIK
jgi:hypothetical protein